MRIPRLIHPDDTLYSTFLNLISYMPCFHMHQVENEDGQIIRGYISGKVMKKIGKNMAEDLVGLLLEQEKVQGNHSIYEYFPSQDISIQTIQFMYRNHLISKDDFQSLFHPKALYNVSKNMFGSFLHNESGSIKWFPLDSSSIFNSWVSSGSRDIYNALGKKQQRMFNFFSIKLISDHFFRYTKRFHVEIVEREIQDLWNVFFKNDQLFYALEEYEKMKENADLNPIIMHLKKLLNNFECIEIWHRDEKGQLELTLFFQVFQFVEENYPQIMKLLIKKVKIFWKKYTLLHESNQFYGKLGNIKLYLLKYFYGRNLWPSSEHINEKIQRLITPLDELEFLQQIFKLFSLCLKVMK
ncbi:hypothetical protein PGTUg99_025140 [Puccinia graminis f. sp. tritici]|uniref:Uncharacterized protein n=1 Tax=Puccinia graminis f. sp. tritici TaxID=56615 RepID=A0A5B0QQZ3_PUCGR|nr:hypothetical protein PGTUg99_025140 [Puccinia graminis f. sp. tritici]